MSYRDNAVETLKKAGKDLIDIADNIVPNTENLYSVTFDMSISVDANDHLPNITYKISSETYPETKTLNELYFN